MEISLDVTANRPVGPVCKEVARRKSRKNSIWVSAGRCYGIDGTQQKNGNPIALEEVPSQLAIVKRIKEERASGATLRSIAAQLTVAGVPTAGGNTVWRHTPIVGILKGLFD